MSSTAPTSPVSPEQLSPVSELPEPTGTIDKETLRELMQPSLMRWSVRVAVDWSVIVIAMLIAGYTRHWAAYVGAVIVAGVCQHRLAIMAHEGTHRQISRNKLFNDFLTGFFCLWPFGNPVGGYRRIHFIRHRRRGLCRRRGWQSSSISCGTCACCM